MVPRTICAIPVANIPGRHQPRYAENATLFEYSNKEMISWGTGGEVKLGKKARHILQAQQMEGVVC